jgi:hypothetical protein
MKIQPTALGRELECRMALVLLRIMARRGQGQQAQNQRLELRQQGQNQRLVLGPQESYQRQELELQESHQSLEAQECYQTRTPRMMLVLVMNHCLSSCLPTIQT